ncbi:MAG TPA: hypothetical protein DCY13_03940 [Verrucomicrobiales bacterium]|nr:hypothetical protein [Verrucomicrobiales bacterium]
MNDAEYIQIVFKQSSIPLGTLLEGGEVVFTINDRLALRFPINKQVMNTQAKFGEMATLAFVRDIGQGLAPLNHKP